MRFVPSAGRSRMETGVSKPTHAVVCYSGHGKCGSSHVTCIEQANGVLLDSLACCASVPPNFICKLFSLSVLLITKDITTYHNLEAIMWLI